MADIFEEYKNLKSFEVKNSASLIYDEVVKLVGDKK